ncbi:MAG: hypothetical protein CFE41_20515 [Burkholderiales bacterium PBB2]|nr:MAG: hypothetical protein CFE41_20515 [Burkholderiales bacterium PBB2]
MKPRLALARAALLATLSLNASGCAAQAAAEPGGFNCHASSEQLRTWAGTWVEQGFFTKAVQSRQWFFEGALDSTAPYTELSISADGSKVRLGWNWHEGAEARDEHPEADPSGMVALPCFGDTREPGRVPAAARLLELRDPQSGRRAWYQYLAGPGQSPQRAYFKAIFQGCFANAQGQRWCFEPNGQLRIGKQVLRAELMLDPIEQTRGVNALKVQGERLFWLFKPAADGGWLVERRGWASEPGYRKPDWRQPWHRLKPEALTKPASR